MPTERHPVTGKFVTKAPTRYTPTPLVCPVCRGPLELHAYVASARPIALDCKRCDYSFNVDSHRIAAKTARESYLRHAKAEDSPARRGMIHPSR